MNTELFEVEVSIMLANYFQIVQVKEKEILYAVLATFI